MSKSSDTRLLYSFEDTILAKIPAINTQLPIRYLQGVVSDICEAMDAPWEAPQVVFGPGVRHGKKMLSWCDGQTIELAPGQRDLLTVYHEVTHFLGPQDHDRHFKNLYFELLNRYLGITVWTYWVRFCNGLPFQP